MQGDHLGAEEVLAVGDAGRDVDVVEAAVGDDGAGAPLAVVVAVLLDLEPSTADAGIGGGIADLLEVGKGRALVAGVHDIVGARGEGVPPDGLDRGAGGHGDDILGWGRRVRAAVAGKVVGGDIGDGPVVGRRPDALGDGVCDATGLKLDEDGVRRDGRRSGEESETLHCAGLGVE